MKFLGHANSLLMKITVLSELSESSTREILDFKDLYLAQKC